jgi:hypothetical protein
MAVSKHHTAGSTIFVLGKKNCTLEVLLKVTNSMSKCILALKSYIISKIWHARTL